MVVAAEAAHDGAARGAGGVLLERLHELFVVGKVAVQQRARLGASVRLPEALPPRHVRADLAVPPARQLEEEPLGAAAVDRHPRVERLVAEPADAARLHRQLPPRVPPHQRLVRLRVAHPLEVEQLHAAVVAAPAERAHLLVARALLLREPDELLRVEAAEEVPHASQVGEEEQVGVEHDDALHALRQHQVQQRLEEVERPRPRRRLAQRLVQRARLRRHVGDRLQPHAVHRQPAPHRALPHLRRERRGRLVDDHVVAHVAGSMRLDVADDAHCVVHLRRLAHGEEAHLDHLESWSRGGGSDSGPHGS